MHAGRHALSWSAQKLGLAIAVLVALILFAYLAVVAVVVVGEAVAGVGT